MIEGRYEKGFEHYQEYHHDDEHYHKFFDDRATFRASAGCHLDLVSVVAKVT